ncbi:MAG: hypothetical protein ACK5PQ_05690 [Alphaproteobacteria bacterium]
MQKKLTVLIICIMIFCMGAHASIDNAPGQMEGILLKQKFTHLARHTNKEETDQRTCKTYRNLLYSNISRALDFRVPRVLKEQDVRYLVQKMIVHNSIDATFWASYTEAFAHDLGHYSIDFDPFSYNNQRDIHENPVLGICWYTSDQRQTKSLTTYTFWTLFLETLDDLKIFLKDEDTFQQHKEKIAPLLQQEIQGHFILILGIVMTTWDQMNTTLMDITQNSLSRSKHNKESFMRWAEDPRTEKEMLVQLLKKIYINPQSWAKRGHWAPYE